MVKPHLSRQYHPILNPLASRLIGYRKEENHADEWEHDRLNGVIYTCLIGRKNSDGWECFRVLHARNICDGKIPAIGE